ncbi:MAG: DUF2851 family protein [Dehalococcoidia bacterium]|nr:DUF2851 family protein [Dehalococcoidia bacterium]
MTATALREHAPRYVADTASGAAPVAEALEERALVALWLLGRIPAAALPWPLLRPSRAGRGPGPDVREATVLLPSGVARSGDVELHLRASDFERHGHAHDPRYAGLLLHVVWEDDRPLGARGGLTPHAGGAAPTIAVAPALHHGPRRVEALIARGPSGTEPCADAAARMGESAVAAVRGEGRRRLAERAWRAARLAERAGWEAAWALLLERALLRRPGALYAHGLLHLQDLWCARGGCGACPLSAAPPVLLNEQRRL